MYNNFSLFYTTLQIFLHGFGFTKLSSATNGDLMMMLVSVELESHVNCVLTLGQKLSITEMIQMVDLVAVECNGASFPLMLNHGLKVSRSAIDGMQTEMEANVVEELQLRCVPLLEISLRSIEMIQIVEEVGVECHGNCPSQLLHLCG